MSAEDFIRRLIDDLPVGIWVARAPGGEFVYANRTFQEIMGLQARDDVTAGEYSQPYGIFGRDGNLYPEEKLPFVRALTEKHTVMVDDLVIHRHDGRRVNVRAIARPLANAEDVIEYVAIAFFEITREVEAEDARRESEARLHRAQRLEAIGNLAGGIAHDFNNLLTVVQTISSSLSSDEPDAERKHDLEHISEVCDRAAELTRALLGFAGRGKHRSERLSLDRMLETTGELLRRLLGARFEVELSPGASAAVRGDLSQLEQVLMNLVVNARDAMPDGGKLALRTRDLTLDAAHASRANLLPGRYVALEVSDTGPGFDPAVRERVFEPYFSTKPGGSGLGLATVYGIVRAHGGSVELCDNPPHGALVRVLLPAVLGPADAALGHRALGARPGQGTVLVVDDEQRVRAATARALRQLGYQVILCSDGRDAVDVYRERKSEIDVVLLDMVMPQQDGRATYLALRDVNPSVRVVLTTGHAVNEEVQRILDLGVRGFIPKPYDLGALSTALASLIAA